MRLLSVQKWLPRESYLTITFAKKFTKKKILLVTNPDLQMKIMLVAGSIPAQNIFDFGRQIFSPG